MKNKNKEISILICSYDAVEELWSPLARAYQRYWPNCPFNIYLATNHKDPDILLFNSLAIGDETAWSDKILKCIDKIPTEYILLTYDDLFLNKVVDTRKVLELSKRLVDNQWSYFSFDPHIKLGLEVFDGIAKIDKYRQYRNSSPWVVYKKEVLRDLLVCGESAWEFEKIGSERSNRYDDFYSATNNTFSWFNAIVQGKWKPDIYRRLKFDGIVSTTTISMLTPLENLARELHVLGFNFIRAVLPLSIAYRMAKFKDKKFSSIIRQDGSVNNS